MVPARAPILQGTSSDTATAFVLPPTGFAEWACQIGELFPTRRQSVRRLDSLRRPSCELSGPSRRVSLLRPPGGQFPIATHSFQHGQGHHPRFRPLHPLMFIRFPVILCAPLVIWCIADGLDSFCIFTDGTQD